MTDQLQEKPSGENGPPPVECTPPNTDAAGAGAGLRSLYLEQSPELRIALDGPSLVVRTPGRAARRFPFRFLRQVYLLGAVTLPGPALEALLRNGILITFSSRNGDPLGYLWPVRETPATLSERLDRFWERPDWHWKYENWRRAQERRAIRECAKVLPRAPQDLRPAAVERLWQNILRRRSPHAANRLRIVRTCLLDLVQEGFQRSGVALEALARRTAMAQLPADFADILLWAFYPELASLPAPAADGAPAKSLLKETLFYFEGLRPREERRFRRLLDRYEYFLGGQL
ncbi:MAG: CRISPR-associated endonuclease Cas1 [Bryobacterales bacterium]|nr:CRISPR-associated endonuclease Cas1 [Bryobacterales bacterium]